MAEHKIQMTLGGKYEGRQAFESLHGDIKGVQNQMREVSEVSKHALGQIAGSFSGELAGSIRSTVGLLEEIGKGGVWGLMAAGVNLAITATVGWYTEMKKAAEEHRKLMEAMKSGQEALIADQLAAMAAREQASLDAISASAMEAVKAITQLSAAYQGLAAAEDGGIAAQGKLAIAQINSDFADRLNEAAEELKPLVNAERQLAVALQNQETARAQHQRAIERETNALQTVEAKIAAQKEVIDAELAAGRDAVAARNELQKMEIERAACELRLKNATTAAETSLLEHETAVKNARAAVENATAAWDRAVAANEAANEAVEEKAALSRIHDEITRICMKNQVEEAAYIKLYTDSIADGLTHTEAYAALQEKLNGELEKRAEAEKKAAEKAEAEAAKLEAEKAKKDRPVLSSSMSVSIDPSEVGAGVDQSEPVTATRMASEALSEQAKQDAQVRKNMRADGRGMIDYLKGNMKPEFAQEWIRVMGEKYSYDQLETIYKNALKNQLLSTSEQKEQLKAMKDMVKCLEKQGLK